MSLVGLASRLKRASDIEILKAKLSMDFKRIINKKNIDLELVRSLKERTVKAQVKFQGLIKEYHSLKKQFPKDTKARLRKLKADIRMARIDLESNLEQWDTYYKFAYSY